MVRNAASLIALTLATGLTASADFSYTTTQKVTGGSMAALMGKTADRVSKTYFKGQKLVTSSPDVSTILDFNAQTVTTLNMAQKTYTVKKFSDMSVAAGPGADMKVEVRETGQKKTVNGFDAKEVLVTSAMSMDMGRGQPLQMQVEIEMWISSGVPGMGEMRDFYKKNAANFPWSAMAGGAGGNQSVQKAMAQIQKSLADMDGAPVEMIIHVKPAGGAAAPAMPAMPQMTAAQQAQMQQAMAQMKAMQQGGTDTAAAQQMIAAMNAMGRGAAPGAAGSGSLMDITIDYSGYSGSSVPDSVFAIPDGFKLVQPAK